MIKLVAFDWNGTVIDDIEIGTRAESATRTYFGFPETTADEIRDYFEIPIRQYWINAGLEADFFDKHSQKINEIYISHYEPFEDNIQLRSNAEEVLKWLVQSPIENVIFSNHSAPHIDKQTQRLGIRNFFTQILARGSLTDLVHHTKAFKDELLKTYVDKQGYKPQEVIVIGDTKEEVEIGKKFGYINVAITGGWESEKRLHSRQPDFLIHDLTELKIIIQKINGRTA